MLLITLEVYFRIMISVIIVLSLVVEGLLLFEAPHIVIFTVFNLSMFVFIATVVVMICHTFYQSRTKKAGLIKPV